jgi:ADP-heptose:LPS heptosyltransferase
MYKGRPLSRIKIEASALVGSALAGSPDIVLPFLHGIGDQLMLTTVARELKRRRPDLKLWQATRYPELLQGNPDFDYIGCWSSDHPRYPYLFQRKVLRLSYADANEPKPREHIVIKLCRGAEIEGRIEIRPYLFLSEKEREAGRVAKRQIAVHCVGPASFPLVNMNKEWPAASYQQVAQGVLSGGFGRGLALVQVGQERDPAIEGAIDLRGRTSLRETAAILSQSDAYVGTVNGLMHMARAVECRSVILFGGREHSWQSGYICNENLDTSVECAPCWKHNDCEFDEKCMSLITPERVLGALGRVLAKSGQPLEVQTVEL